MKVFPNMIESLTVKLNKITEVSLKLLILMLRSFIFKIQNKLLELILN